jgi:post-segregation antitoxin (ccd killing protein)
MRIKNLVEGLNAQQRSVPQLPAQAKARHISVLGAKTDPKHPFAGYMVGADESAEPGKKSIGPDRNDPWEKGWRAGFRHNESNPYPAGSKEAQQWDDGYAEAESQPRHYDEGRAGVDDTDTVGFSVNTEAAYTAVMKRFGDVIDHDETSGVMYAPARVWPQIEMVAFDADGEGATRDDGIAEQGVAEATGDPKFDKMLKGITGKKAVAKQQKADTKQQSRDAFGSMFGGSSSELTSKLKIREQGVAEASSSAQQAAIAIAMKKAGKKPRSVDEAEAVKQRLDPKCWKGKHIGTPKTKVKGGVRVNNCVPNESVAEAERNEMDTAAVQAALAKMAERHKGEKWSKEQLAALGKRIAARGQKPVKEDDVADFLARGGKITQVKPNRGPRNPGLSLGSKHIGGGGDGARASRTGRGSKPQGKPVVAVESITKEDIITKLKARLGDYLSDIGQEIRKDPDLINKLAAKPAGDQMGPPVKTVTTDDGHEISIHGNEDDGFRISIKNKPAASKFKNLDEAVMACEMYCAHRRAKTKNADYVNEA